MKKKKGKKTLNYPKSEAMGVVSKGLKNEFETAKVNEPSEFELLKFYCNCKFWKVRSLEARNTHKK